MARRSILRKEIRQLRRDLRAGDLKSVDERFAGVKRDTDLARDELTGRLDLLNELRGNVVSREEFNAKFDSLVGSWTTKVTGIDQALDELRANQLTRREYEDKHETVVEALDNLKDRINTYHGGGIALSRAWGYVIGALGVILVGIDAILRATGH